jgi:hypothetical protein
MTGNDRPRKGSGIKLFAFAKVNKWKKAIHNEMIENEE